MTVTAYDRYNNPDSSGPDQYKGTVDFGSTDNRLSGLPGSYTFTTGDAGSHSFANVALKTAGEQTITATDSSSSSITGSVQIDVIPGAASQLVITSAPLSLLAGGTGEVTVQLEDAYGNTGATSTTNQTINLSTTSSAGAFYATQSGGSPIGSVVIVAGQSSASVYYEDTKAGSPILTTSDSALGSSPKQDATIEPGPASQIAITSSALTIVSGGRGPVTVQLEDMYGNLGATSPANQTISLSTTSTAGQFYPAQTGSSTITSTVIDAGQSSTTFYYGDTAVGNPTVTADDTAFGSAPSQQEMITPSVATQLVITTSPLSLIAGNQGAVSVQLEDANGNPTTSTTAQTINLSSTSGGGVFYATQSDTTPITSIVISPGQTGASFYYQDTQAGSPILTANDSGLGSEPTQQETIDPATASYFLVTTSFGASDVAGTPGTVTVTAYDAYNNIAGNGPDQYEGTVDLTSTDSLASGLPASYTFTAADDGSHSFTGVILKTVGTQTITATDSVTGTITGTTAAIAVVAAKAKGLEIVNRPPGGIIAGKPFAITVDAQDNYGNVDTSFNGQITVGLGSGSSGTLSGTLTMNATNGAATFNDLVDTTSGSISLVASSTNLSDGTASGITINPGAAASFTVTTSFASQDVAGTAGSVTITVLDTNGNPVGSGPDQYLGTVDLSSTDAKATGLPSSYTFTAADAGSHTFSGVTLVTAGSQSIGATDSVTGSITGSASVDVIPAAASQLEITSGALSLIAGGIGKVTTRFEDAYGNPGATSATDQTISLSTTSPAGTFYPTRSGNPPVTSVVISAGQDSAAFYYSDTLAGTPTLDVTDTAFDSTSTQVETIDPAPLDHFVVTTSLASPDVAGATGTLTVAAQDKYNNVVGSGPDQYLGTVDLSTTDSQAKGLPATYTFAGADAGSHTFAGVSLETAGSQTISASDSMIHAIQASLAITVVPGAVKDFSVTTTFANPDVAGTAGTVTVTAEDAFMNVVDSGPNQYEGTIDLVATGAQAVGLPASYTFTAGDAGSHTFTGVIVKTAGSQTITGKDSVTAAINGSATIEVIPAAASQLVITSKALALIAGGEGQVTVQLEDPYGNPGATSTSDQTVALSTTSTAGVFYAAQSSSTPITSVVIAAGQSGGSLYYRDTRPGTPTLTADDTGLGSSPTQQESVSPAAADHFVVTTTFPDPDVAGTTGTLTVKAFDAYGNLASGGPDQYEGTADLTSTDTQVSGLPSSYTFTAADAGSHTFAGVILKTAGTQSITATDSLDGKVTGGATVDVTSAPAIQLVFTTPPPTPLTVGQVFTAVISAEDRFHNVDRTFHGDVTITLPGGDGSNSLSGTTTVAAVDGVAQFTGLTFNGAGNAGLTLDVSGGGLTAGSTSPITVKPSPTHIADVNHPAIADADADADDRRRNDRADLPQAQQEGQADG